jgi:hypothetical protein
MTEPNGNGVWKLVATSLSSLLIGLVLSWLASTTVLDSKFTGVQEQLHQANEKLDEQKRTSDYQNAKITDLEIDVGVIASKLGLKSRTVEGAHVQ